MLSIAITYVQHRPVADRCLVKKLLLVAQSSDTDGHLYIVGSLTIDPTTWSNAFAACNSMHAERGTRELYRGKKSTL